MTAICPQCNHTNDGKRYFCGKCGTFLDRKVFVTNVYEGYERKLKRIIENMTHIPHENISWDKVIDEYVSRIERCRVLFDVPEIGAKNSSLLQKIDDFLEICYNPEFQIAFVGTIKTGKSTLINALLGHNYASMAVTPETAALTRFKSSRKDYIKVSFYKKDEWKKLWASRTSAADAFMREYNALGAESHKDKWVGYEEIYAEIPNSEIEQELKQWSSSQCPEHYFVREIEVGISTLPDILPEKVVFVDTPGLSDPVAYRSEITKEYIRKANAVFVCVDAQKLQQPEIATISSVFSFSSHNKNKVHIIATHLDKLNNPNEDWQAQYAYLQAQLIGKAFFDDPQMAARNIMPSAAYIYNICRDKEMFSMNESLSLLQFGASFGLISPQSEEDMFAAMRTISDSRDKLMELSNISRIRRVIVDEFAGNYKTLLHDDIMAKYKELVFALVRFVSEEEKSAADLIETANADISKVKQKVEEHRRNYDTVSRSREQLAAALRTVEKKTQDRLAKILSQLEKVR